MPAILVFLPFSALGPQDTRFAQIRGSDGGILGSTQAASRSVRAFWIVIATATKGNEEKA